MTGRRVIAIIGGGAAGAFVAIACTREEALRSHRIVVLDSGPRPARGVAYSTADHQHLLNTTASQMSAVAGDDGHFLRWLRARNPGVTGDEYRPRAEYGDYVAATLAEAARNANVEVLRCLVTDVRRHADGVAVEHTLGVLHADAVVLALGNSAPAPLDVVTGSDDPRRYVADPWSPGAMARLAAVTRPGDELTLVGAGLTAVDVALTLTATGRKVRLVSRHGTLPRPHRTPPPAPVPAMVGPGKEPRTAAELEAFVLDHVARTVGAGHDWRAAIDGLRPITQRLWQALPVAERKLALAGPMRRWEIHRHRMAPLVAQRIRKLRRAGRLTLVEGDVLGGDVSAPVGRVELRINGERTRLPTAGVVNCTGPTCDLRRYPGPLGQRLLDAGTACSDPTGVGIATTSYGAVVDAAGVADLRLTAVGPLRRGSLLETTAAPEIRMQAGDLASLLAQWCSRHDVSDRGRRELPVDASA